MSENISANGKQTAVAVGRRTPLAVAAAHWRLALAAFLLTAAAGAAATLLGPRTYESSMRLLVTRGGAVTAQGAASGAPPPAPVSDEEFGAKVELLLSPGVLEAAGGELGLTSAQAVGRLRERLSVTPVWHSRAIKVTCRDDSPERAARTLDALFRSYEAHLRRLGEQSGAGVSGAAQVAAFNQKLAEARERLRAIEARGDAADIPLRRELLLQQYYQTLSQLNATRTDLREAAQRVTVLRAQLAAQPARLETESRTEYAQASVEMRQELARLEAERARLLAPQGTLTKPDERLVKDLDQRIGRAKELIAREERAVPRERAVALNDVHQRLTNDLLSAEANQTALAERERALGELSAQIQGHVRELERQSAERGDLERARAASEEAFLLYSRKAQEAAAEGRAGRAAALAVTLAEAPSVNARPVSPRPLVNLAASALAGLLAACVLAYVAEARRPRLSATTGAKPRAELRVLAKIPEV
jgi:uncharacterized protein involved in exopolysaccharide biosynthesis